MNDLKSKLGKRIQEIRKSKGLTQEKLAELINIDIPNLSNIERGKKFMTASTLEKIITVLGIEEKDLFDFEHIKSTDELKKEIRENINKLSHKELQFLSKTINNIIELRI